MKLQVNLNPWIEDIRNAKTFRFPKNLVLEILIFLAVFYLLEMAETCALMPFLFPRLLDWAQARINETGGMLDSNEVMDKVMNMMLDPVNTKLMLFSTLAGTIVVLLYIRIVEGRKLRTAGFRKEHAFPHYLLGLLSGFLAFSMVVGTAWLMGGVRFAGYCGQFTVDLLLILLGFILQGMSEEVVCRGYMMSATLRFRSIWWAIGINSLLFSLMHAFNNGFTVLAAVNLFLCGVQLSLYALRTGNLWGACAFHSIWNFVQGNFYGLPVSGIDSGDSVFSMELSGGVLANGGSFGLEASLPATIVMVIWIFALLFVPNPFAKKKPDDPAQVQA